VIILGIDTSDSRGGVAIRKNGQVTAELAHQTEEDYSSWLLPAVAEVLKKSVVSLPEIDVFSVSTGPGSFTGLRVGLTTVKAWAEVHGKPLVGISRLEAMASRTLDEDGYIAVSYDAQRGHVFGGLYRTERGEIALVGSEMVASPEEFLSLVAGRCGRNPVRWISLDPELITGLAGWQDRVRAGDTMLTCRLNLASFIAELGERAAKKSRFTDALLLDADYVRRSDAEIFWKDPAAHGERE
jgi:tRNA threonylcarbamoyladenosine biosynthesis protein TsaB